MDLDIHSSIRLHDVVLNYLNTGTTFPLSSVSYGAIRHLHSVSLNNLPIKSKLSFSKINMDDSF
jgi:hypothetical protein